MREVPAPAGNLALRNVERSPAGIVARIASTWPEPRPARVTLRMDGRAPIEVAATIPPHQAIDVPLTVALPAAGSLQVSVTDPDGFAADNDYYVVLDAPARPRVLLVTGEGAASAAFYVTKAIQATEAQSGFAVDQTTADQVDDRPDLSSYAAVAVLGSGGLDRRGADALADASSRGTGLVVVAGPTIDAARFTSLLPPSLAITIGPKSAPEAPLSLAATDGRHPVFAALGSEPGLLGSVRFVADRARSGRKRERACPLLEWQPSPAGAPPPGRPRARAGLGHGKRVERPGAAPGVRPTRAWPARLCC